MSSKNMLVMVGTMYMLRKVDQEEPVVLLYARLAFVAYLIVVTSLYSLLHWRITSRCDLSPVTVPLKAKAPSFQEAMDQMKKAAEEQQPQSSEAKTESESTDKKDEPKKEEPKTETITTMEYDLRTLSSARRSWVMNCLILAAVNYKTESVSAIVISPLMTLLRFVTEDPLFLIHVAGSPAVDKLKRPFTPSESPFATLLKEMAPKEPIEDQKKKKDKQPVEDLHDDGESEEEDNGPTRLTELKDDHIKSDFDEDDEPKKTK